MKMNVYSVYDSKAEAYLPPFFMRADGEAVRAVSEAAKDRNHQFFAHAGDYTLFRIADFDDAKGVLTPLSSFVNLGNVLTMKSGIEQKDDANG